MHSSQLVSCLCLVSTTLKVKFSIVPKSKGESLLKYLHDNTFGNFGAKSLGMPKIKIQNLAKRPNFFSYNTQNLTKVGLLD